MLMVNSGELIDATECLTL